MILARDRDLHPGAWWAWALGLAAAASTTTNPLLLGLILATATLIALQHRSDHPWSRAFRIYLWLAVGVVVARVVFKILLGGGPGGTVILDLPTIPLPDWVLGIRLLGPLTLQGLLGGIYEGLRLGTVLVCIGAANAVANPKRLLKSLPPALYEIGTAVVVALTVLPQLADSVRRVSAARSLRESGRRGRRWGARRVLVPVLEDALERSLALAAGMDARGYGRSGNLSTGRRWLTGTLMLGGLVGICVGVYAALDQTAPRALATPMIVAGLLAAAGGFVSAGRRVRRTRYRPEPWQLPETVVALSGLAAATLAIWLANSESQGLVLNPDPGTAPPISTGAFCVVLLGLVPLLVLAPAQRPEFLSPVGEAA